MRQPLCTSTSTHGRGVSVLPVWLLFLLSTSCHAFLPIHNQQQHPHHHSSSLSMTADKHSHKFTHALAILAMPYTSLDRIANEVVLNTILPTTNKLSVVLRCQSTPPPSLARLRRYVGEVYSQLWDCVMYSNTANNDNESTTTMPDICVYPAQLPNTPPESWMDIQPDLQAVCSHDSLTGWSSEAATGRGRQFQRTEGRGGLQAHVQALNAERAQRNLPPVVAVPVPDSQWPVYNNTEQQNIVFVDDDVEDQEQSPLWQLYHPNNNNNNNNKQSTDTAPTSFLGGPRVESKLLFDSVCCGGTFDGLHFGHRKLLTLAVSSVTPGSGRLCVGVTVDAMLTKKEYAQYLPPYDERCTAVQQFLQRLAPGMMNRIQVVPIHDSFGPPGAADRHFDALVLSHETLDTGRLLNQHRVENLGLEPLTLLCTRRTEAHGMSSTTLRKLRANRSAVQQRI